MASVWGQKSNSVGYDVGFNGPPLMIHEVKCDVYIEPRNLVSRGRAHLSTEKLLLHGAALPLKCCKVSIDEALKPNAWLPFGKGNQTTVGEALKAFVAWPIDLIKFTEHIPVHLQCLVTSKSSSKQATKNKRTSENSISTHDLQKQTLTARTRSRN